VKKLLLIVLFPCSLIAQTVIYRSVQPVNTSAIATGAIGTLTIASSIATFSAALPDTVGVGCAIQYDDDGDGDIDANDSICFIHGRTSSTVFTVANATGGTPTAVVADADWSIFHAYTAVFNWESGTENTGIDADLRNFDTGNRNIDTNNEQWNVACYRGRDVTEVTQSGWTTSSTDYIRIYTPSLTTEVGRTQRHAGVYTTAAFRWETGNAAYTVNNVSSGDKHIRYENLQIFVGGSATGGTIQGAIQLPGAASVSLNITECIIKFVSGGGSSSTRCRAIVDNAASGFVNIRNNIIYGFTTASTGNDGAYENNDNATSTLLNNTVYDCVTGFRNAAGDNPLTTNCVFQAGTDGWSGTFSASSNYNVSNVAADAPGANSTNSATVTFASAGSNFHLGSGDTVCKDTGTDMSASFPSPPNDVDNETRPINTVWDRGADEFSVSAPTTPPTFLQGLRRRIIWWP